MVIPVGGACPKCGDIHTKLSIWESDGVYNARCACLACGYQSSMVSSESSELAAETASRLFNMVIVRDVGFCDRGLDRFIDAVGGDIAKLLSVICSRFDCPDCPLRIDSHTHGCELDMDCRWLSRGAASNKLRIFYLDKCAD